MLFCKKKKKKKKNICFLFFGNLITMSVAATLIYELRLIQSPVYDLLFNGVGYGLGTMAITTYFQWIHDIVIMFWFFLNM